MLKEVITLGLIDQATHSDNDLQPLEKLKIKRVIRYGCYTQE